ncbi:hypothetical protein POM88_019341 [Heracleum sosnowskyi]|uniref:Uncharacterized protein n=1 Tax=Heracleum sosnowskyi TaxID=360622 RepID=A0AAD8IU02_9APIA|nr:hypothetical protein POM88_019341 [Heracleum sosnowskyi]
MSGAANGKRHEIYICKEELVIAFKTLFNHTNGEQNTSVPKALLYIVQVFLECVRINLQRTIIMVSFDKGLYLDEMIIRYQHGVSAASLFHRLDRDHSDQTRFFQFIVDMIKLKLMEVNDIYGRSQNYFRCSSMAGKHIFEVPPTNVGGITSCIGGCARGIDSQKALESFSTLIIKFRDEEKASWLRGLICATYRASVQT